MVWMYCLYTCERYCEHVLWTFTCIQWPLKCGFDYVKKYTFRVFFCLLWKHGVVWSWQNLQIIRSIRLKAVEQNPMWLTSDLEKNERDEWSAPWPPFIPFYMFLPFSHLSSTYHRVKKKIKVIYVFGGFITLWNVFYSLSCYRETGKRRFLCPEDFFVAENFHHITY